MDSRNNYVDIMRGIAIQLVVIGHILANSIAGIENSLIYNVIWTLQMPMFFLISGYVTKYSKMHYDTRGLWAYISKRTISYILPWITWSFLVKGFILGETSMFDFKWLLWHMDSGYWFLASIWTISIIFGLSMFSANLISRGNKNKRNVFVILFCFICLVILFCIGKTIGIAFFAIKYSIYYMPFYCAGFLYGQYQNRLLTLKQGKRIIDIVIALSLVSWFYIVVRVPVYTLPDFGISVVLRVISSISGCIAVFGIIHELYCSKESFWLWSVLKWCGYHSLEIYLTHIVVLAYVSTATIPFSNDLEMIMIAVGRFVAIACITYISVCVINANKYLRLILFGKQE